MSYLDCFQMPRPVKIMGRTSSIRNSFVNGIVPCVMPSEDEVREALSVLGMTEETLCCAYCGDTCTEWDHLNPLVRGKLPTGYVSEIHNLVPACGKCNQSKGSSNWEEWMFGPAPLSPKTRGIVELEERAERLREYERQFVPVVVDFQAIIGEDPWKRYWAACDDLVDNMRRCQDVSDEVKERIEKALRTSH